MSSNVAQVFNLLYRRFSNLRTVSWAEGFGSFEARSDFTRLPIGKWAIQQVESLRYDLVHSLVEVVRSRIFLIDLTVKLVRV